MPGSRARHKVAIMCGLAVSTIAVPIKRHFLRFMRSPDMADRPVIMVIDDEPNELAAMLDALTRRFGGDYRVVPYLSAPAALDALAKIKRDGEEVALVIADQWMPDMTGNE